ncbi:MAG TPA: hypothetical protein VMH27_06460 [Puia sp.]|nr:hypothetical protein [Puia sp.]
MNAVDLHVFEVLFREACRKCFGHPLAGPLTETESRLMYTRIFEDTGLVVGWKSIKNYSLFVLSPAGPHKSVNPSVATLDTLSRYVAGAPYLTEPERKKSAGHYPYWYAYKSKLMEVAVAPATKKHGSRRSRVRWGVGGGLLLLIVIAGLIVSRKGPLHGFSSAFKDVSADSLRNEGWWVHSPDSVYWKMRGATPGCLSLFTLCGDNWPDSVNHPIIHNLLIHRITCDCWTMEVHLKDFVPRQDWQQAGILLLEDSNLAGKSMRVSIAYNDFNGVYPRSGSILLQAISSGGGAQEKPEEFAHSVVLQADSLTRRPALYNDLAHSAIRIEKQGDQFRVLYADGISENTSFKEISSHSFSFRPRYVGLFALRGYVDTSGAIPAHFTWFGLDCCNLR